MSSQEKRYQLIHPISVSTKSIMYYGTLSGFGSFKKDIAIKVYRDLDALETQEMVNQAKVWATLSHTKYCSVVGPGTEQKYLVCKPKFNWLMGHWTNH